MGLYSAIDCAEMHATRAEDKEGGWTASAQVVLRCRWEDRFDLLNDILDNRRGMPGTQGIYARKVSLRPMPTGYTVQQQEIVYKYALATVTYEAPPLEKEEEEDVEEYYSESLEPTAEFITLDAKLFQWGNGEDAPKLKAEEAPGKLVRGLNLVRDWKNIQGPLPPQLLSFIGCVNNAAYYSRSLNLVFGAETLLYCPPVMSRTRTSDGFSGWNIQLKFMYQPNTWNKFWRAATMSYEHIYIRPQPIPGSDEETPPQLYKSYPPASVGILLAG